MSRMLVLLAAIMVVPAVGSQEKRADTPNTLTAKEIADGWILLFDGETTFGWNAVDQGKWTVAGGMLAPQAETSSPLVTSTEFGEFQLRVEYILRKDGEAEVTVGADAKGNVRQTGHKMKLFRTNGEKEWYELSAKVTGKEISKDITYRQVFGAIAKPITQPESVERRGHIALLGRGVVFRTIKLRPLNVNPIFNGKDLTGWKEVKDEKRKPKSVYSVTEKGELNVKNGPGDLQTEAQWDDFILQLDVISNGKHLNSGVFFRALPGEFWSGYEAQIRNQWQGDDRTKPVDFGTGAIYNRQPARRVVSSDNEWFTMTVIAHGNHLATWVNGYPVADFTDTRPANRNARNGTKTDKGVISLQGHDPGTDLSFRNIRIAELPKSTSP